MNVPKSAQSLLAAWRRIAADFDRSLGIPAANEFYRREVSDPETMARLRASLSQALTVIHPEFAREVDYSWVLDTDAALYHPPAEALYQLHVLHAAATLWNACELQHRNNALFSNLMARYSRLWGSVGNTSPKARRENEVSFIVVPFGWDELLHASLHGLQSMAPSLFPADCVVPAVSLPVSVNAEAAVPSWNSLLARALASELGCHDVLTPGCIEKITTEVPQLTSAVGMPRDVDSIDPQTARCALAMLFAIAHEVGHHLGAAFPLLPGEDEEKRADRLAANVVWDCPGVMRGLHTTSDAEDSLGVMAGALFFCALQVGTVAERSARRHVSGERASRSTIDGRMDAWLKLVEILVQSNPQLRPALEGALALFAVSNEYCEALDRYADSVLPHCVPTVRRLVEELHAENPNLHDALTVDRRIRDVVILKRES